MKKVLAAITAALFAFGTTAVMAQDKKEPAKTDQKKVEKKKKAGC